MNKNIILALISNTLQKEFRNKTLMFLLIFTLAVILIVSALFKFMYDFSEADTGKMMISGMVGSPFVIFYYIISIWNGVLAIVLGVNCIKSDERCSVLPQLLSLPIKRSDYIISRVLGSWIIIIAYYIFSLALGAVVFSITLKSFTFNPSVFLSLGISSFSMLFVISISAFFSLHMPKIMAFIGTLFFNSIISVSNSQFVKYNYEESLQNLGLFKLIGFLSYWLFPRIGTVNDLASTMISGEEFNGSVIFLTVHFVATFGLFYFIFNFFFNKRQI